MANLDIDVNVKGAEKLTKLEQQTEAVSTKTVALGNIYADIAGSVVGAFGRIWDAGNAWQEKLNDLNNTTEDFAYKSTDVNNALGQTSHSLVKAITDTDLYKNAVDLLTETLDGWTSIITGKTIEAVGRQRDAVQEATEKTEANTKAIRENVKALREQEKAIRDNIKHQLILTRWEEKALKDREAQALALAKEKQAYEDKLKALDASIDAINAETDAQIANSQAKGEAVEVTEDLTQSLNEQADATNKVNTENMTFSSTGETQSGAQSYAQYALGMNLQQPTSDMERYLREIAESSRDTNDAVRGY